MTNGYDLDNVGLDNPEHDATGISPAAIDQLAKFCFEFSALRCKPATSRRDLQ
jgi:hypothetical protein